MTNRFEQLRRRQESFVKEREWGDYHRPKNLAMAISVEAAELTELYQWRDGNPSTVVRDNDDLRERTREELADILIYTMSMGTQLDLDLLDAVEDKLEENDARFAADDVVDFTDGDPTE